MTARKEAKQAEAELAAAEQAALAAVPEEPDEDAGLPPRNAQSRKNP
jgi:hypothetical protein